MIGYASSTGTRRNRAALAAAGWRLLMTPSSRERPGDFAYGLDNGAWTAHTSGQPFDEPAFLRAVGQYGRLADWIVVPDIVAGGAQSLAFSLSWLPRLRGIAPLLLAVQDGMEPDEVAGAICGDVGVFVGGSTAWKLAMLPQWGRLAHRKGCWLHVGRVNSARRIALCAAAGAQSIDGTSASRYSVTLPRLDAARRQLAMPLEIGGAVREPMP